MADPIKILFIFTAFGIIYASHGSSAGFGIALVFYFFANGLWNAGGAWPEAWYRVRRISYRQFYIIAPNRRIIRPLVKESDLKIGSAARAEIQITKEKTGEYFVPTRGNEMFNNPHGAPAGLYNWDDCRPNQVFGQEPDSFKADGTLVPKAKVDPMLVHAAYKNDILERRHRLNIRGTFATPRFLAILLSLTLMFSLAALFYSYYFGININCAEHTKACI